MDQDKSLDNGDACETQLQNGDVVVADLMDKKSALIKDNGEGLVAEKVDCTKPISEDEEELLVEENGISKEDTNNSDINVDGNEINETNGTYKIVKNDEKLSNLSVTDAEKNAGSLETQISGCSDESIISNSIGIDVVAESKEVDEEITPSSANIQNSMDERTYSDENESVNDVNENEELLADGNVDDLKNLISENNIDVNENNENDQKNEKIQIEITEEVIQPDTTTGEESTFLDALRQQLEENQDDKESSINTSCEKVTIKIEPRLSEKRRSDVALMNALEILLNSSPAEKPYKPTRLEYATSMYTSGTCSAYSTLRRPHTLKIEKIEKLHESYTEPNISATLNANNYSTPMTATTLPRFEIRDVNDELEQVNLDTDEEFEEDKKEEIPETSASQMQKPTPTPKEKRKRKPSKLRQFLTCSRNKPKDEESED